MATAGFICALNLAIAAMVLAAWGRMAFRLDENGVLTARGLYSLKYFTVLSNLMQAAASAIYAAFLLRGAAVPRWLTLLKYASTVSVGLTFATVATFLGPVFGFAGMFAGSNLWLHLIVPLAAVFSFCALERDGALAPWDVPLAALPMLLYGAGYVANLLVNGIVRNGRSNDWYGFARHGLPGAAASFAIVVLATLALAWLIRLPRRG